MNCPYGVNTDPNPALSRCYKMLTVAWPLAR